MATNFTYTTGIPIATDTPAQDQPNMAVNTTSVSQILNTDHLTFGAATAALTDGMHTVIHLVNQPGGKPATVAGTLELYSKSQTFNGVTEEALFIQTALGNQYQITQANNTSSNSTAGYTFLPGGIILQYGNTAIAGSSTTVTFAVAFPSKIITVIAQPISSGSGNFLLAGYGTDGGSTTGFKFKISQSPLLLSNFTWIAIGV